MMPRCPRVSFIAVHPVVDPGLSKSDYSRQSTVVAVHCRVTMSSIEQQIYIYIMCVGTPPRTGRCGKLCGIVFVFFF